MANPTTNYGFVLPTSSDLVTDLPADFDVALQGVDTRLKALQPGTTEGDLAYSSATADTNTRLAIGSTGNVLTVAGGVPTWAAPAGGSTFVGCSLWNSTTVSAPNATETIMTFDSELFDTDGFHSTVSNTGRITIPTGKGGYYLVTGMIVFLASSGGMRSCALFKNGGATALTDNALPNSASQANDAPWFSYIGNFAATDYLEIKGYQNSGAALNMRGAAYYTRFSVSYLGA
jgi:hypothetical protein